MLDIEQGRFAPRPVLVNVPPPGISATRSFLPSA